MYCLVENQCDHCFDGSLCCFGPLALHVSRFTCGDPPGRTATVTPLQQKLLRCSLSPARIIRHYRHCGAKHFLLDRYATRMVEALCLLFPSSSPAVRAWVFRRCAAGNATAYAFRPVALGK